MPVVTKNKALAVFLISAIHEDSKVRKKRRQVWTKNWLKEREEYSNMRLLEDVSENHESDYKNNTFGYLLEKVRPRIKR
jgi:hypothetical protein